MKRIFALALVLAAVIGLSFSAAYAGPGCGGAKDGKVADGRKTCGQGKSSCQGLGEFPTMTMKVGDKTIQCPVEAKQVADESGAKILFVVAGHEYTEEQKARSALACASEKYVENFVKVGCVVDGKVVYCCDKSDKAACEGKGEKAAWQGKGDKATCQDKGQKVAGKDGERSCHGEKGEKLAAKGGDGCCPSKKGEKVAGKGECDPSKCTKFVVLGREFTDYKAALAAREAALAEIHKVKMTYVVDGKEVDCSEKVCPNAKAAGKVEFVVGKDHMKCEDAARCTLAKAQYEAARATGEKLARL